MVSLFFFVLLFLRIENNFKKHESNKRKILIQSTAIFLGRATVSSSLYKLEFLTIRFGFLSLFTVRFIKNMSEYSDPLAENISSSFFQPNPIFFSLYFVYLHILRFSHNFSLILIS